MPIATTPKKVRVRADRIKPELRAQLGVTEQQIAAKSGIVVAELQVPDYKSFDEMFADLKSQNGNDENAVKAKIFGWADTQMATSLRNAKAKEFEAPPVSKSVSQADAINWAKANDKAGLLAAIDGDLNAYLEGVKAKVLAERAAAVASGQAVEADDEEDAA